MFWLLPYFFTHCCTLDVQKSWEWISIPGVLSVANSLPFGWHVGRCWVLWPQHLQIFNECNVFQDIDPVILIQFESNDWDVWTCPCAISPLWFSPGICLKFFNHCKTYSCSPVWVRVTGYHLSSAVFILNDIQPFVRLREFICLRILGSCGSWLGPGGSSSEFQYVKVEVSVAFNFPSWN